MAGREAAGGIHGIKGTAAPAVRACGAWVPRRGPTQGRLVAVWDVARSACCRPGVGPASRPAADPPDDGAARLDGLNDLRGGVAGQRKAGGGGVDLHGAAQSLLRPRRHAAGRQGAAQQVRPAAGGEPAGASQPPSEHTRRAATLEAQPAGKSASGRTKSSRRQGVPAAAPWPSACTSTALSPGSETGAAREEGSWAAHLSASSRITILWQPGGSVTFCCANILILLRTCKTTVGCKGSAQGTMAALQRWCWPLTSAWRRRVQRGHMTRRALPASKHS